jgi:hypothetical protein
MDYDKINKEARKIRKAISKGVKSLRQYRLKLIEEEYKKGTGYDGGVSILLSYLHGRFAIDFGFEQNCGNLIKCAQEYRITHPKPIFNGHSKQQNDLFETNFLRDIFYNDYNNMPVKNYVEKMEKYIQTGNGIITNLIPVLDIFSQRQSRYLNVGLGLFGLMEKNRDKAFEDKSFLHLKKRICRELADIFHNKANYDPLYLDTPKAYALFLLFLLEEEDRIEEEEYEKFIFCAIRNQNSLGNWTHTSTFDIVNEVNNMILTIFCVVNLLNYYQHKFSEIDDIDENDNNNQNNNQNNNENNIIEGFAGGFLTQQNFDQLFFKNKACFSSMVEIILLLIIIAIAGAYMVYLYRRKNI